MTFKIEPARADDVPRLAELLNDLFGIELDFTADPSLQTRGLEMLISEAAKSDRMLVAVARDDNGLAIGMASAQLVISTSEGAASAWIEDVVVHPDFRRQGLGRQLLEYLLAWAAARAATRAQLVTDSKNPAADLFYNGLGWQSTQLQVRRRFIK
jgi:GNAT superfamily N-acetyltransferase